MTDIDELSQKQERLSRLLRIFLLVVVVLGIVLVGTLISYFGQENPAFSTPSREAGSLFTGSTRPLPFA